MRSEKAGVVSFPRENFDLFGKNDRFDACSHAD